MGPSQEIFGIDASRLVATPEAPEGIDAVPMLSDMSQKDFAMGIAMLINYILDDRENTEEMNETKGFLLGGGGSTGSALNAILLE